ncbi:hypothetical protein NQ318_017250 [Aromia moschata]|uniref:Uncharacterized protein n=1 Tax=Aromia moschata TaxID=1265417 RepID=A0AAV8YN74_9CUCU|nr:hypothetical protein NQ318_017250 [Aromia moschata]
MESQEVNSYMRTTRCKSVTTDAGKVRENKRATFKGLNKYGTCFASQSPRPPPRWPGRGHLEYGIPIRGRLEDGRYPRILF